MGKTHKITYSFNNISKIKLDTSRYSSVKINTQITVTNKNEDIEHMAVPLPSCSVANQAAA